MTTKHSMEIQAARLLNTRRVWQGAWLFVPGALVVLFPGLISSLLRLETWIVVAAGALALLVGIYWSASGAKCPSCELNLLWHGMTHAKNADWFTWVMNARSCPRCDYPKSDRSEG
jgi:hypothetical protein